MKSMKSVLDFGGVTRAAIPKAPALIGLDPMEGARLRWKWGEAHMPKADRIEIGSTRNALHEAYEEALDEINYLLAYEKQMKSARHHSVLQELIRNAYNQAIGIRTLAISIELEENRRG